MRQHFSNQQQKAGWLPITSPVSLNDWSTDEAVQSTAVSLSYLNINNYSADEAVQAAVNDMVTYIKASGMTRAFWYAWKNDEFGAMKNDGTYRLLWNVLTSGNNKNTP